MGKIYYIMGKSAAGKDTIFRELTKLHPEWNTITLYTTRPIRENEIDGVTYHFVEEDMLKHLQKEGKVIESRTYNTVHGPWTYATVNDGQVDVTNKTYISIGTLESFEKVREFYGADVVIPIYLEIDNELRKKRALDRENLEMTPKMAELTRRFEADEVDFSEEKLARAGINVRYKNHDIERCIEDINLSLLNK